MEAALEKATRDFMTCLRNQGANLSPVGSILRPVKIVSGRGPLNTHLYISWEKSLPNGEGSLGNLDMLSE